MALEYGSDVRISCGGRDVNGKSILELMTLTATCGSDLDIHASGEDSEALVECLVELISSGFGE